jgi:hypothetical protein
VQGVGTVRSGTPLALPWRAGSAFGYAMELREERVFGGGAMLRDAVTAGFEVLLDDGRVVSIPPSRIRIVGRLAKESADKTWLDRWLDGVASGLTEPARPLCPYDYVRAKTIKPGDRVAILSELTITADGAAASAYRANAGVLVPVGIPILRVADRPGTPAQDPESEAIPDSEEAPSEAERGAGAT